VLIAAVLMLAGLAASNRSGRLQYVSYMLMVIGFAAYVLSLRSVLNVAGVVGIE
jgi:hypothetical protein